MRIRSLVLTGAIAARWRRASAVLLASLAIASRAHAWPLRDPQVPISGTTLQSVIQQYSGASIRPDRDQLDRSLVATYSILGVFAGISFELVTPVQSDTFGVYSASQVTPTRMALFPPGAVPGWFAVVGFRRSPPRTIVDVFDERADLLSIHTYAGADTTRLGLYLASPVATYYSEDARNDGHEARILLYADPNLFGPDGGYIACEDQPPSEPAPGDFADVVVYWSLPFIDPVQRTSWSALKQRFR